MTSVRLLQNGASASPSVARGCTAAAVRRGTTPVLLLAATLISCSPHVGKAWRCEVASASPTTSNGAAGTSGLTGGTGIAGAEVSLLVTAGPNSVLSASATVSWVGPITSIAVMYNGASTPWFDVSSSHSPATEPVLGLLAGTAYNMRAVGRDASGNTVTSAAVTFTTGTLPSDLPVFATNGTQGDVGYTLVAPMVSAATGNSYLEIVDGAGMPVWYYLIPEKQMLLGDFQQQPDGTFTYASAPPADHALPFGESAVFHQIDALGNDLRTWTALGPDGSGAIAADMNGKPLSVVSTNLHEIRLQPNGDALLFGFATQNMNLEMLGGQLNEQVYGSVLERVAPDGTVRFAWNSFEYLAPHGRSAQECMSAAEVGAGGDGNLDHANSIDVASDGNYLVSLRNFDSVVKIDSTTGAVIWRLGGACGDFTFVNDPQGGFSGQHGVRELPNGDILLFDNGVNQSRQQSRAVEYALDTTTSPPTATLVWSTTPSTTLFTQALGFAQRLANGDTLVDYGEADMVEEWDPTGTKVVWTLTDPSVFGLYRAFRLTSLYRYSPSDICPAG